MDEHELRQLKPELDRFLEVYAPLFGHEQNFCHAQRFVQGLYHKGERRNAENIAEAMQGGPVRTLQAFITTGAWHDEAVFPQLRRDVLACFAQDDAIYNLDETGFAKKGTKSVGVKRQYSGTLGRVDNCQIAVFANYCSDKGHTLVDRRLYLPKEWAEDPQRRKQARVPEEVVFRTKPELALEMVESALAEGMPFRWVGGDSVYGDSTVFVQGVRRLKKDYVLDVSANVWVWTEEPQVIPAEQRPKNKRGRRPSEPLVIGEKKQVADVLRAIDKSAWKREVVGDGSQGPRVYECCEVEVWFSEEGLPGPKERLIFRRSPEQKSEVKSQRSNAPTSVGLTQVVQVGGSRWSIEEDFQAAKGECGLAEYETRGWPGWHHHTVLSVLALAFLALQRYRLKKKRATDECA